MVEFDKKTGEPKRDSHGNFRTKTAHSLNPVPVYFYDPGNQAGLKLAGIDSPGISSLAATCMVLLGFEPPADYTPSLVETE